MFLCVFILKIFSIGIVSTSSLPNRLHSTVQRFLIFRIDKRSDIAIIQEYTTRAGIEFHGNESVHIAESEPPRYREDFLLRPKQYSFENGLCGDLKNTIRQQSVNIISSTILIRSLIGVDRKEAMRRFSTFLSNMELNSEQEEFLMTVISYVCEIIK